MKTKSLIAALSTALIVQAAFAGGDKSRPMVFYCVDAECWLSYNAALRAIKLGYTNVMWYRGGVAAWRTAELPMAQSDPFFW